MKITLPDATILSGRCNAAANVLVSAPFYSGAALSWVKPSDGGTLEFWTRLNPFDWANDVVNPPALLKFLEELGPELVTLRIHRRLHAKIYMADSTWAWIGSANLSRSAMQSKVELMNELEAEEVRVLADGVDAMRGRLVEISLNDLSSFIDVTADAIADHHRTLEREEDSADMQAAVSLVDELVADGAKGVLKPTPPIDDFVEFLGELGGEHAEELVERHAGKGNLSGHFKQCYFGAVQLLSGSSMDETRARLAELSMNGPLPAFTAETRNAVADFLDENATMEEGEYKLSILRRILPESWGGYTTSGGGASPTMKRMLPYVARFLDQA